MIHLRCASLFLAVASLLIQTTASATTIRYSVTPLGDLGGGNAYGTALNDNGDAVGYSDIAGGGTRAFLWTEANGMQNLGNVGGGNSRAYDINNAGDVVGQSTGSAFRWNSGSGMVQIAPESGSANGLNTGSEAVGIRTVGSTAERTIRWNSTNTQSVHFVSSNTAGVAINDNSEFVGTNAFGSSGYFSPGTGTRTNIGSFIPSDINNARIIAGSMSGEAAAMDFDLSMTTLLGKLSPTDTSSRALGVNQAGKIVGESVGTGAFIYDSVLGLQNLTDMLRSQDSAWEILIAEDINNTGLGQILALGRFDGINQPVILTGFIVPEPGSATLMAMGLICLSRKVVGTLRRAVT